MVVFNAALFDKHGVPSPAEQARRGTWTWGGFGESLRKVTSRRPEQPQEVSMAQHLSGLQYVYHWVFGAGGQVWSKDLKRSVLDAKEAVGALEFLAQLHYRARVAPQPEERADFGGDVQDGFTTGRVAVRFRPTTELYLYKPMAEAGAGSASRRYLQDRRVGHLGARPTAGGYRRGAEWSLRPGRRRGLAR